MISFQQLCELLTINQHYSWFYFSKSMLSNLTPEEKSLVWIEEKEADIVRLFYPANKCPMTRAALVKAINKALIEDNFEEVLKLKQKLKEINEQSTQ